MRNYDTIFTKDKKKIAKLSEKWFREHYIWSKMIFIKEESGQEPLRILAGFGSELGAWVQGSRFFHRAYYYIFLIYSVVSLKYYVIVFVSKERGGSRHHQ